MDAFANSADSHELPFDSKSSGYYFDTLTELNETGLRNLDVIIKSFPEAETYQLALYDKQERSLHDGVFLPSNSGETYTRELTFAILAFQQKSRLLEAELQKKSERISELERMAFGSKSEKVKAAPKPDGGTDNKNAAPTGKQKTERRNSLPENLPRDPEVHDLPQELRNCSNCGGALHPINAWDQASEQLVVVREHMRVRRHIQKTYGCRCCESSLVTAPKPPSMVPGSCYDSPETLAYLATQKFQFAIPFYRLEQVFERCNVPFSRTSMARLLNECVDRRLTVLYELLKEELRSAPVVHGDETGLQVLKEPDRKAQTKSFLWAYATAAHFAHPVVIFDYQQTRSGEHAKAFLTHGENPFSGILVCDGFKGYNCIPGITLSGCWTHARRKFEAILKELSPDARPTSKAKEAFDLINRLYAVESRIKMLAPDTILELRQAESKPIVDAIKVWLLGHKPLVPPETGLGKAIAYTLNEWDKLIIFLGDGRVPIDNNADERQIRHFAIGRKNWLFADSVAGGYTNAVFYSLVRSAIANGLDPYEYLKEVFTWLPAMTKAAEVKALLPWNIDLRRVSEVKLAA